MDFDDFKDFVKGIITVVFLVWIVIFVPLATIGMISSYTSDGQQTTVSITVTAVEQKTIFGEHTDVTGKTLSDTSIRFTLEGYYDFNLNQGYTITYVSSIHTIVFGPFLVVTTYGKVSNITALGS
jgi:hypothetical protein